MTALYQHRGSKKCDQNRRRFERAQAREVLESLPEHGCPPPAVVFTSTPLVVDEEQQAADAAPMVQNWPYWD